MRPSATVALRRGGRHRVRDAALLQGSASKNKSSQTLSSTENDAARCSPTLRTCGSLPKNPVTCKLMLVGRIIPAMREFYDLEIPFLVELMGFAGFVTMSFAIITFMSRSKRGRWAWVVIFMSVTAEIALNVFGSFLAAENALKPIVIAGVINITNITSVIVGLLPAIINMATGETLRQDLDEMRAEEKTIDAVNTAAQGKYQSMLEQNYVRYLKRQGINDETKILEIISGIYEEDFEPIQISKPDTPQLPPSTPEPDQDTEPIHKPKGTSPRAIELADKMKVDGNERLTNGEIKEVYGISSPNIMSQARALLRLEGVLA